MANSAVRLSPFWHVVVSSQQRSTSVPASVNDENYHTEVKIAHVWVVEVANTLLTVTHR